MAGASQSSLLRTRRFLPFFLTQALGAFNDNLFKNALVILIMYQGVTLGALSSTDLTIAAAGLFILPFFLFSATFGQLADKYEKSRLIRATKLLEVAIMALAALGLVLGNIVLLLSVLFLMGTQSTLFGPVKYGILPQHLHPEELIGGNALVESATFLSILLGMIAGQLLIGIDSGGAIAVSIAVLAVAVLGWWASRAVPVAPASAPELRVDWNVPRETWRNLRFLAGHRTILLSVLGISWFWFYGATFIQVLPGYAKDVLGGDEQVATLMLTLFSVGIGAGSLLCETLSRRTVEIGLVPLGAFGLTLFGIDLYLAQPAASDASGLSALAFLQQPGAWRVALDLVLIGIAGGFFIVPLYALIQQRADPTRRSRVIAGNNILNAAFMVASALLSILALRAGLSLPQLLLATAVLNLAVAIYIFTLVPEFLMRLLSWLLVNLLYRVEVDGIERVPDEGPALVVCNHVSFMDALLLGGAVPRPIRFVMYHRIFQVPVLNWVFRTARAIPIAPEKEDAQLMQQAFAEIDAALAAGELVGIFPEGMITHDGEINAFRPGVERILAARPVPVVPVALRGMWGSLWSRRDSRLRRMRLPRRLRARVEVKLGEPLPAAAADAATLEQRVRDLRGELR